MLLRQQNVEGSEADEQIHSRVAGCEDGVAVGGVLALGRVERQRCRIFFESGTYAG